MIEDTKYQAVLGYEDPANGIGTTRVIASGNLRDVVIEAGMRVYDTFLADKIGVGRQVAGRNGEAHRLKALDELRLGVYDNGELVLKIGGEQE